MKKEYFAPEAQGIEFLTEELMVPSYVLNPDGSSSGGDDDTTIILPFHIF